MNLGGQWLRTSRPEEDVVSGRTVFLFLQDKGICLLVDRNNLVEKERCITKENGGIQEVGNSLARCKESLQQKKKTWMGAEHFSGHREGKAEGYTRGWRLGLQTGGSPDFTCFLN